MHPIVTLHCKICKAQNAEAEPQTSYARHASLREAHVGTHWLSRIDVTKGIVSPFVIKDKEPKVSTAPQDNCCMIESLFCSGCSTCIGKVYKSTPKHLDFKRDLYCLDVDAIDSYIIGSTTLQEVPEKDEPLTLEKRSDLEEELERANTVLKVLQDQISALQAQMS
ncbi:hypothetical protein NDU88_007938 [Pleurodeles waltl]|uniref:Protein yippee-like n=1 Tax=Pleurodeles waltl TaxID=8319 RepID=A0AAV7NUH7_PLEWA|nr:hypothetical protein NDU88_007938 [Pleurodeles waltl]